MSGSCDAVLTLQIRRRLHRSAPHRSSGVTTCLVKVEVRLALTAGRDAAAEYPVSGDAEGEVGGRGLS